MAMAMTAKENDNFQSSVFTSHHTISAVLEASRRLNAFVHANAAGKLSSAKNPRRADCYVIAFLIVLVPLTFALFSQFTMRVTNISTLSSSFSERLIVVSLFEHWTPRIMFSRADRRCRHVVFMTDADKGGITC